MIYRKAFNSASPLYPDGHRTLDFNAYFMSGVLNAVLLRDLPCREPQQLVLFGKGTWRGSQDDLPDRRWQLSLIYFSRVPAEEQSVWRTTIRRSENKNGVLTFRKKSRRERVQCTGAGTKL